MNNFFHKIEDLLNEYKESFLSFLANHKATRFLLRKYMMTQRKHPDKNNNRKRSLIIIVGLIVFLSTIIVGRLLYVQIERKVDNVKLTEQTRELYQGEREIQAKRGTIYDRNGIVIAEDATSYSVYAVLDKDYIGINNEKLYVQADEKDEISDIFHKYLGMKKSFVKKQLNKSLKQVEFGIHGSNISLETRNKIQKALKEKGIKGIYFTEHPNRIYPNGVFASYLIGYASLNKKAKPDDQKLEGVMGIEAAFDKELAGHNGKEYYQKDANGEILPGTIVVDQKAKDGKDIYTTLDANLETYLESLMTTVDKKYKPENMTVMLVDAKTGEIIAAGQRPTFNPETKEGLQTKKDKKGKVIEQPQWRNLLVQDVFEPGSVMKPFLVAAAIEKGKFNPNDSYQAGSINLDGTTIRDWDYDKPKILTYAQALIHSSNVGMVLLEQKIDSDWQVYLQKFGFNKSTNSGLPGELAGNMQTKTTVDRAMTAFGQAISVTNFQMMQAYTALANQGEMLKLRYISKITDPNTNKTEKTKIEKIGKPISKTTAKDILDILVGTAEDQLYGTGTAYKLDDYTSSVKTGTAQIYENGSYSMDEDDFLYSVVQIAPTENPKYIIYATIKKPKIEDTNTTASEVLSSITKPLMERALNLDSNSSKYKKNTNQNTDTDTKYNTNLTRQ